jgi:hypothetical protein
MIETHTVQDPLWLQALIELVDRCTIPLNLMGPLGYRWLEPGSLNNPNPFWIIGVYPTPSEAYGGCHDGEKLYPGFTVNVGRLINGFSELEDLVWNNPTVYDGDLDGPEIAIKGYFTDVLVLLRIFHIPPSDEDPTLVVNLANGDWCEKSAE